MKKISVFIIIFLFLTEPIKASIKEKIILNLKSINNITFNFEQKINDLIERGKCTIEYPKKIFCTYDNEKKKIMISNGKTLVITNKQKSSYYLYPLNKTPLELILDKNFLISEIENLDVRNVDNKYYNFTIVNENNKINIFFNNKNYNLIGWQTEDIYQNLAIIFISKIKTNQTINKKIFEIPKRNMN